MLELFTSRYWEDYELIDTGNQKKIERFNKFILIRPEPAAIWSPKYTKKHWYELAHAEYQPTGNYSGKWEKLKPMPDRWVMRYRSPEVKLRFFVELKNFKNVGVFPEQAVNWDYIMKRTRQNPGSKVLNLFGYTGLASITAKAGKSEVTHIDALKSVIAWGKENMKLNNIGHIRWLIDDVRKFVAREIRRGNKYHGIILDPPAFGHGPKKEKWILETDLNPLLGNIARIMYRKNFFLVLNVYSLNMSALSLWNVVEEHFKNFEIKKAEIGETFLSDDHGRKLSTGILIRIYG